ncbi:MAG: Ldh family oxidoreductase, partial [Bacteroidales bacterium]
METLIKLTDVPVMISPEIRIADIKGEEVPKGWGVDEQGQITTDPDTIINKGGLLPLGGTDEMSGYKGYGLSLLVDILSGVLSGSNFGTKIGRRISPVLSRMS